MIKWKHTIERHKTLDNDEIRKLLKKRRKPMEKVSENLNKYGEEMEGKFSHNPHGNGIVISVTNPFVEEIHIECDNDISNTYWDTYSLLAPQADHPEGEDWEIYYNTREQRYYRSEWQPKKPEQEGSESGYIWVRTDKEYIVKHARRYEELQAHFRTYDKMHKGQFCVFRCYAIDPNGNPKKPSTVESMFDRHKWFYSPWSFKVSLLNGDTIDDFVGGGTPISKEMTDKMVRYHQEQDKAKQQRLQREREAEEKRIEEEERRKEEEERRKNPGKREKLEQRLAKYPYTIAVGVAIIGTSLTYEILRFIGKKIYSLIFPN